jgi:hypothetical protein
MGSLLEGLGRVIMVVGAFLVCGNLFDHFRTLPFLGVVTVATGGAIVALARDGSRRDGSSKPRRPP